MPVREPKSAIVLALLALASAGVKAAEAFQAMLHMAAVCLLPWAVMNVMAAWGRAVRSTMQPRRWRT